MELVFLIVAVTGVIATVIFGFLQVIVPFLKGEIKFSRKFPFVMSTKKVPVEEAKLLERNVEIEEKRAKIRVIMFTDIKGYTARKLKNESRALKLLEKYKKLLHPIFSKHKGSTIRLEGDEFLVQFGNALEATACAIAIQKRLEEYNTALPEDEKIQVRIGIHTGPVEYHKKEVVGKGVEIASSIGRRAKPGSIYVTEDVSQKIRSKIETPLEKLSKQDLDNTQFSMHVYRIVLPWEEGYEAPPEKGIERIKIAVVDFVNETNEKELTGLSGMLITALEQSRRLSVLTRPGMLDILKQLGKEDVTRIDEALGREIGRKANLNALAIASIRKFGEIYSTDLKILDPQRDEYLFTTSAEGRGQECIPSVIDAISQKTRVGLEEKLTEIQATSQSVADITTVNLEAYQHYFMGEEFINKLKFKAAQEEFRKAIALDSTFGLAYYRLAYAIDWELNKQLAKEYIQKALSLIDRIPKKERYIVRAMNAQLEEGYEKGIAILKEMEQIYPDDKEMIYNIGDWSYHLDHYTVALAYLEKVLKTDPAHDRALQHLTWTYRDMGQYEKMLECAKRYVSVTGYEESYNLLAIAYAHLGDLKKGLSLLQQARELSPEKYTITATVAEIYALQEQYDKALSEIDTLVAVYQPDEVKNFGYEYLAQHLYPYIGKYREALQIIDMIIEHHLQADDIVMASRERNYKALFMVWGKNDVVNAKKEIEKTLVFQNQIRGDFVYLVSLANLHVYLKNYAEAEDIVKLRYSKFWHSYIMSLIHCVKHECDKAEFFANSVLRRSRRFDAIVILYHLAECQFEAGKFDDAQKSLFRLQGVYDNSYGFRGVFYPKSFCLLGKIYEQMGKKKLAIKNCEKLLEIWKDADEDLPDLIEVKKRMARLKSNN